MPQFKITKADGKIFKAADLKSGKSTLLVYFSPECDHCQVFMKAYFKKADAFAKANVLMITYLPADRVVTSVKEYPVNKFTNITVGTEGMTFVVRDHLGIQNMPFAALYDKKNRLIRKYERDIPLDELQELIKKME
jgi:protein-disulfide isomerase